MSWIQQNKFVAVLFAGTLVLSGLLLYVGNLASKRYERMLAGYQEASAQVASFERLALYPSQDNVVGKDKALKDYEQSIQELVTTFEKFQSAPGERLSPQEFSNRLVAANQRISGKLKAANVTLPTGFYSGFEKYTNNLAQSGATLVLDFQLGMIDSLFEDLAAAKPTELLNFVREGLPEEAGVAHEAKDGAIARPYSFEITFQGTEASARKFLTSLIDTNRRFAVIRSLRIMSESTTAPRASAAQFVAAPSSATGAAPADGGFFNSFFDPAENPSEDKDDDAPEEVEQEAAPQPVPLVPRTGGSRILAQVAGNEMVRVFVRFDVLEFLAVKASNPSDDES